MNVTRVLVVAVGLALAPLWQVHAEGFDVGPGVSSDLLMRTSGSILSSFGRDLSFTAGRYMWGAPMPRRYIFVLRFDPITGQWRRDKVENREWKHSLCASQVGGIEDGKEAKSREEESRKEPQKKVARKKAHKEEENSKSDVKVETSRQNKEERLRSIQKATPQPTSAQKTRLPGLDVDLSLPGAPKHVSCESHRFGLGVNMRVAGTQVRRSMKSRCVGEGADCEPVETIERPSRALSDHAAEQCLSASVSVARDVGLAVKSCVPDARSLRCVSRVANAALSVVRGLVDCPILDSTSSEAQPFVGFGGAGASGNWVDK